MGMRAEVVAPFVAAAVEVLSAETGVEVHRGKLWLETGGIRVNGIAALISLVGRVEGLVMLNLDTRSCLALVSAMIGEEQQKLNELVQSAVAELCNVIAGKAATKLSRLGMETNITVPSLIIGNDVTISILRLSRLVIPLEAQLGKLELHLALKEG